MAAKKCGEKLQGLSKRRFLEARVCVTRGWYLRRQHEPTFTSLGDAELFLIEEGLRVGELARQRYPNGVLVDARTAKSAEKQTQELLTDKKVQQIFEATFRSGDFTTRADILVRVPRGWQVIEVKSSRHPVRKSKLQDLIDDLAYTVMVAQSAGLKVQDASLLLIAPDYRLGMGPNDLFVEREHISEVRARVREHKQASPGIERGTAAPSRPKPELISGCNSCEFFSTHCLGKGVKHPVTELPRIGKKISTLGAIAIADVAKDAPLTPTQKFVADSVWANAPRRRPTLQTALDTVQWPAYYLDFEATATALPLYADVAPYEAIPCQYSIHRCAAPGKIEWHRDYLADPAGDCRHELATRLLEDVGRKGSVVVYSSYENRILRALAERFADLAARLDSLAARLFDLEKAINGAYYHPDFRGSYSIKRVLPVMVKGAGYEEQAIRSGKDAAVAFARLASGEFGEREAGRVKEHLREYCKQDTLAMVDLHAALMKLT